MAKFQQYVNSIYLFSKIKIINVHANSTNRFQIILSILKFNISFQLQKLIYCTRLFDPCNTP